MAILTYAQGAEIGGFQAYLMQQGMAAICQQPAPNTLELLAQRLTWGTHAEAGDSIRFSAFLASGSAVIDYGGQWMDDAGVYKRYNQTLNVSSGASPARLIIPASPGWYRDAAISLQTAGITGQTLYVTHELGRTNGGNFVPIGMLAQGWLTSTAPVSDKQPGIPDGGGSGGGGGGCCVTSVTFTAGNGTTSVTVPITVAAGTQVRLVNVLAPLVTGATAGNRRVYLHASGGGADYYIEATLIQGASLSYSYFWQIGGERFTPPLATSEYMPLPTEVWFSANFNVVIQAENIKAGDDFGLVVVGYEVRG